MSQHNEDPVSNPGDNRAFSDVVVNLPRRRLLQAGMGAAALAFFGVPALTRVGEAVAQTLRGPTFGFQPIPAVPLDLADLAKTDTVRVPAGYSVQVLYRWGDPSGIHRNMPEFRVEGGVSANSAAEQAAQAGMDHDGMHFFPLQDNPRAGNQKGVLCVNHENIQPEFLLPAGMPFAEQVAKMKAAHGVSVIEVRQNRGTGEWRVMRPSRYARRITGDTPMRVSGPAAGDPMLRTTADPTGRTVLGTLNNCANGATPWGTYLTCEENFNIYFQTDSADPAAITPHMRRYGVAVNSAGYNWHRADARFDVSAEPNESNRFGWVVEIDPFDPAALPVKRTALGRFKHENAAFALTADGRVVMYMGDDERNEYIYKFVSSRRYDPRRPEGNRDLLDDGVLYVAVFEEGDSAACDNASPTPPPNGPCDNLGRGRWVPLVFGQNGLTPENGFASQAEVLIKCRQAADRVGATMMDRPEWIAVRPGTNDVYCTLTNNNRRGSTPPSVNNPNGTTTAASARPPRDEANPRADNVYGHIIRWRDAGGDPGATTFEWGIFVLAGDPANPAGPNYFGNSKGFPGFEDPSYHIFSAPDGLWFDAEGRMWIQTDYGASPTGVQANMGNCHMLCADVANGYIGRFLTGPNGCEITGLAMSPDRRSVFVNIQHPGEGRPSTWPDDATPPRSATVVITRTDGGVIGA
jgi:hypothetical protein